MKLTIVLKKEDADGLGGEILVDLGMTRSETDPQVFWVYHSYDPTVVAPADVAPGMWATKYVEALADRGIRPLRVLQKTNSMLELPQVQATVSAAVDKKDWQRARKIVNEALEKAGFEGNKPFGSVGRAFSDAVAVLRQQDMDQAEPFIPLVNQVEGKETLDLLFHNEPAPGNLAFMWYKKDSGSFEVIAYVS
jgi:hypothetical protein